MYHFDYQRPTDRAAAAAAVQAVVQVGHLVALAQQRQVEAGQLGHFLFQLRPEGIGAACH